MKNYKLVKTAAAVALGASVVTASVVSGSTDASAASKYKVSHNKLVNAKTGKVVKGYVVYKSTLYYNGKVKKGYKTVGSGSSIKLYYNGKLKKGYKTAKKGGVDKYYLFYNGKLKKGYKTAGNGERLYKDGRLDNGYEVYGDVEKDPSLYYNGYLKKGYKTANKSTLLFYNGKLKAGYKTAKKDTVLYKDGRLNVGQVVVNDILFDGSKQNEGLKLYKDALYKDGKVAEGLVKFEDKFYNDGKLATGTFEYEGKEIVLEDGVEVGAKVKSVEAINGTTLVVTFNKALDKAKAEEAVVKLDGKDLETGKLSEDGKTLTITTTTAIKANKAKIEVPAIQLKDSKELSAAYTDLFSYEDTVAPTIVGTEQVSSTQVKVKFSEPVAAYSAFTLQYADGKDVEGVTAPTVAAGETEVTFDLSDDKVEVGKAIKVTAIGLTDVAGNIITPNPATFDITKQKADGVAPVVNSVSQTGAKTFEVTFSKVVKAGDVEIAGYALTSAPKTEKATSDTTFVVTADKVLEGVQNVSLKGFADIDGQKITDTTKVVTFAKDEVAPTVTSSKLVKIDGKENIELTFDKVVKAGEVKVTGSYVKDYVTTTLTEKAVTAVAPKDDKTKKVLLVPVADFADVEGAKYDVKINSTEVTSDADQAMKEATASFTRSKDDAASVTNDDVFTKDNIEVAQGATPSEVTVTFTGEVDGASAINTANYVIDSAVVESATVAPIADGKQVVTLKLKANSNQFTGVRNITVSDVKVKNSTKVMAPVKFTNVSLTENVAATVKSAKLVANNKVELAFSENVETPKDAKLFAGKEEIKDVLAEVSSSDAKVVTITLPNDTTFTAAQLKAGLEVDLTVSDSNQNETKVVKQDVVQP